MHSLETGNMAARDASSMHPLWSEYVEFTILPQLQRLSGFRYAFPADPHDSVIDLTRDDAPFYFNPYSGELSLEFPRAERKCRGGILADEMGMGKTIMLSALIQTLREPEPKEGFEKSAQSKARQLKLNEDFRTQAHTPRSLSKGPSATLIVAPTSLLAQWAEELQRSSKPGTIKVLVWHGQNRRDLESLVADDYEGDTAIKAVVTSYGVLVSEHAKSQRLGTPQSLIFESEFLVAL
jgi:DNA repair protein RAD5